MRQESSEELLEHLVGELRPVRRTARVRVGSAIVLATGVAVALLVFSLGGVRPDLPERLAAPGTYALVLASLLLAAFGAVVAAIAGGTPGRENTSRAGRTVAGVGLALGAVALLIRGLLGASWVSFWSGGPGAAADVRCLVRSLAFGALPCAVALYLAARGASWQPWRTAAAAGLGAVALGALVVHLSCPADGARHVLLGHVLAPLAGGALAAGGAPWLARWREGIRGG